jgi:hypothetical protein
MNDMIAFGRLLGALRPWLHDVVVVGGWCHRLHRFHPSADPPAYLPLMTHDADLALPQGARLQGDIGAALRKAGFMEDFRGEAAPPVIHYRLDGSATGFYAEFLAPLSGSGTRRDGTADATLSRAGVTAQKVRHLDLLVEHPWTLRLGAGVGIPVEPDAEVLVANPVCFIAQKLLIPTFRSAHKRAQDSLYIHDTIELFGAHIEALGSSWRDRIRPALPTKIATAVEERAESHAAEVTDVLRAAARIPRDRALDPGRLQRVTAYGLEQIFRQN